MRIFVYKTLFIFLCLIVTFKLTFGSLVGNIENKINEISSKEKVVLLKEKVREEIKRSLLKDNILEKEDAVLIGRFLQKISKEIKEAAY